MLWIRLLPAAAFFACVSNVGARADDPNCLVTEFKTAINDKINKENYIFLLDQVDEAHYDSVKNDLNVIVPGYFIGDWKQFKEKRDSLKKNYQLTTDERYSRQYVISTLSPEGVAAYTNCLRSIRGQTELSLYPAKTQFNNKAITFVIDLKSPAQVAGPALIEIFGASRLLSAHNPNDRVTKTGNVIHISISNFRDFRTFSIERQSSKTPVRVTAEDSGLVAEPAIEFGPVVEPVIKFVDVPLSSVEDTIHYLGRRLEPGTSKTDWPWSYSNLQGSAGDATGQVFVGNMCICASGQRQMSGDFHSAGRCVSRAGGDDDRLLPKTVRLTTPGIDVMKSYTCGGQQ